MPATTVRPAREGDLDRLVEIHLHAYPDARGAGTRIRNFTQNTLGALHDLRVVERAGRVVGHGFLFPLEVWLGGERVPVGGVASIGVAPEARGQRVASELLASLHAEAEARGFAMTLLYAFREGFYARHGYASTAPIVRLALASASLRGASAPSARSLASVSSFGVAPLASFPSGAIDAAYARAARLSSGMLVRSRARWEALLADERTTWLALEEGGEPRGWVAYAWDQPELHGRARIVVRELVAERPDVRLALLDRLGALGDQADDVALTVAHGDPLLHAFVDAPGARRGVADLEHPLGRIGAGPMVRLAGPPARALAARGWAADGELTLRVRAADGPPSTLALRVRAGRAEVAAGEPGAAAVELRSADLAAVVAAGPTVAELVALGRARSDDPALVGRADAMLSGPRFSCLDPF